METENNLSQVRQKIADLPGAIMYSINQHGIKLPSDNIDFVRIDDDAQLWFISHFPPKILKECNQVFPARLHFFRNGTDVSLEISGKATIMSNISDTELYAPQDMKAKKSVLIKMTMNIIQYTESYIVPVKSKLHLLVERGYRWLVKHLALDVTHSSSLEKSH